MSDQYIPHASLIMSALEGFAHRGVYTQCIFLADPYDAWTTSWRFELCMDRTFIDCLPGYAYMDEDCKISVIESTS